MNVVFLSPHFPPHYYRFCQRLRGNGVHVLGLGDAPYDQLAPELRDALTEYYRVDDMNSHDQLVRACGYFTHRYGKLDRFESLNEYWLEAEARIRTDFNIPGVKTDTIANIKLKSRMKEIFRAAGVQVARGGVAHSLREARELAAGIGYPLVAKPDNGIGASHTCKIDDDDDLSRLFLDKPPIPFIFEEFIRGRIVTFDGLTDAQGRIVFWTSHEYSHNVMDIVQYRLNHYYWSVREIARDLEDAGRRCVAAFDTRERFFHIEFFRRADGSLMGIEVNMRPPGGATVDMFNFANDVDMYQGWADIVTRGNFDLPWSRKYFCAYIGRRLDRSYTHSHEEILARLGEMVVHHQRIDPPSATAMCDYGYLVRSPCLDDIHMAAKLIHAPGAEPMGWVGSPASCGT